MCIWRSGAINWYARAHTDTKTHTDLPFFSARYTFMTISYLLILFVSNLCFCCILWYVFGPHTSVHTLFYHTCDMNKTCQSQWRQTEAVVYYVWMGNMCTMDTWNTWAQTYTEWAALCPLVVDWFSAYLSVCLSVCVYIFFLSGFTAERPHSMFYSFIDTHMIFAKHKQFR